MTLNISDIQHNYTQHEGLICDTQVNYKRTGSVLSSRLVNKHIQPAKHIFTIFLEKLQSRNEGRNTVLTGKIDQCSAIFSTTLLIVTAPRHSTERHGCDSHLKLDLHCGKSHAKQVSFKEKKLFAFLVQWV